MTNKVRYYRRMADITQSELAQKMDVSRQTIYAIEAGRYIPSTMLALKLTVILKKPLGELFALELSDW